MAFVMLHQSIVDHDAIGWDIQQEYRVLSAYAECHLHCQYLTGLQGYSRLDREGVLRLVADPANVVIYHHSNYWEFGEQVLSAARGPIVFRYHNVTPPSYFRGVPQAFRACVQGREQTFRFVRRFEQALWLPDSRYNLAELGLDGLERSAVVHPFAGLAHQADLQPDPLKLAELLDSPRLNILCTGRFVPNKGHRFVVEVAREYKSRYGGDILVTVIGKLDPLFAAYRDEVLERVNHCGLAENFRYIGAVSDAELLAYYLGSDLYLCCSEHEGFCVPVAESQFAHLPLVARNRSAVPETLGLGQILLDDNPAEYADAIERLRLDGEFRRAVIQAGRANFDTRFSPRVMENAFVDVLHAFGVLLQ